MPKPNEVSGMSSQPYEPRSKADCHPPHQKRDFIFVTRHLDQTLTGLQRSLRTGSDRDLRETETPGIQAPYPCGEGVLGNCTWCLTNGSTRQHAVDSSRGKVGKGAGGGYSTQKDKGAQIRDSVRGDPCIGSL